MRARAGADKAASSVVERAARIAWSRAWRPLESPEFFKKVRNLMAYGHLSPMTTATGDDPFNAKDVFVAVVAPDRVEVPRGALKSRTGSA